MREKFRRCVEPSHGAGWARLWDLALGIDGVADTGALFAAFRP
jgi:hypothetical protein